ncbi:MAG: hypothetical protein QM811_27280 [Pirellulales bacterium]
MIDVTLDQIVRVLVVAAKHAGFGEFGQQRMQGREILRRRAFADQQLHPLLQLFFPFVVSSAFVVGLNAGGDIVIQLRAA